MRAIKTTIVLAGVTSSLLLAGCAVLRIDVDVYKGPLANHRDVQAQQLWAMAIAARPLLTELRDTIEWDGACQDKGKDAGHEDQASVQAAYEDCLNRQRKRAVKWYKDSFVDPDNEDVKAAGGGFQQYQAIRVNEILGLYEPFDQEANENRDKKGADQDGNGGAGDDAAKGKTSDNNWWKVPSATGSVMDVPGITIGADQQVDLASVDTFMLTTEMAALSEPDAVGLALAARRRWERLFDDLTNWAKRASSLPDLAEERHAQSLASDLAVSTNVNLLSILLFEPGLPVEIVRIFRSDFPYYIQGIYKGRSIERQWPFREGMPNKEVTDQIERALARAIFDDPLRYMPALRSLDAALRTDNGELTPLVSLVNRLQDSRDLVRLIGLTWPGKDVADVISNLTIEKVSSSVGQIQTSPQSSPADGPGKQAGTKIETETERSLSEFVADEAKNQNQANSKFVQLNPVPFAAGGLKGGRLKVGIFDLTKRYLETKKIYDEFCSLDPDEMDKEFCASKERQVKGEETVLTDALARFAEKILTIANNDTLFRSPKNGVEVFSQLGRKQLNRFVIVLQAVGNAILVQVDELRRRASHEAQIRLQGDVVAEVREITGRFTGDCTSAQGTSSQAQSQSSVTDTGTTKGAPKAAKVDKVTTEQLSGAAASDGEADKTKQGNQAAQATGQTGVCNGQPAFRVHGLSGNAVAGSNMPATTMEALDRLITALKHEQVQATLAFPGDAAETCKASSHGNDPSKIPVACLRLAQVTNALDLAYQHRSGMVYIRPPGAYLRTSFAATNLQGDPNLGWNNLLLEQARRSMPYWDVFEKEAGGSELQIQTQIDKRFWQNINSVRVAGSGRTDFVLVKDDIGNWYVKGVSADPRDIFSAAQSSALFGIGGKIGANLLLQRNLERDLLKAQNTTERTRIMAELDAVKTANRNSVRGGGTELAGVLDTYVARYVESSGEAFRTTSASVTHAEFQTFLTDQSRVLTAPVTNPADAGAMAAHINGVGASASVQTVYADRIAPGLAFPDPAPSPGLATAANQSAGMIAAANGLIAAAAVTDREVGGLDFTDGVSGADGLPALRQRKATAETAIRGHEADLANATSRLSALDAVIRQDADNASDATRSEHENANATVNRIRQDMLAEIQTRDDLGRQIAALEARVAQAAAIQAELKRRLQRYFRGKVDAIYAARKALNDQLDTAVSVLATPARPAE